MRVSIHLHPTLDEQCRCSVQTNLAIYNRQSRSQSEHSVCVGVPFPNLLSSTKFVNYIILNQVGKYIMYVPSSRLIYSLELGFFFFKCSEMMCITSWLLDYSIL